MKDSMAKKLGVNQEPERKTDKGVGHGKIRLLTRCHKFQCN